MALQNYRNVLVPIDGSDNALRAVDYAGSLAKAAGLQVLLLHVAPMSPVDMLKVMGYPAEARHNAEAAAEFEQARNEMAEQVFVAARARLPEGVEARQIMLSGDPARIILEQADELGNAIIVMGNRGLSTVRELVIGGVSNKVFHHARWPVTIVR